MALTTCPDCGNQVSTEAAACPKCGRSGQAGEERYRRLVVRNLNRTTAGLLALLLGGLGVHRFYLGRPGTGILYLLFCWTGIPLLLGLIEGIILLSMSDAEFTERYCIEHPPHSGSSSLMQGSLPSSPHGTSPRRTTVILLILLAVLFMFSMFYNAAQQRERQQRAQQELEKLQDSERQREAARAPHEVVVTRVSANSYLATGGVTIGTHECTERANRVKATLKYDPDPTASESYNQLIFPSGTSCSVDYVMH
jgi:TM2 domain